MSEEKLTVEAFLEEASDMKNKIKELEQRLGALEKKYELNKENIPKTIHKYYNKNKEKIAELKEQIGFLNNGAKYITDEWLLIKDVLREFFKKMLHYSQIAEFPSDQAHTNLRSFYETQLKKLDGEKNWNPTLGDGLPEDARFPATDGEKTCDHQWEMRDPENIGHSMAFCKKCGYLRDSKPSLAGSARQTERKCETCRYRAVVCEDWVDECDDHNKWEPIKIFQAEEREDVDRQTVFCPICGNEITKIEHVVFHDFKVIVAREDLEQAIKRESWLLDQLFPTHYGSDDFNKIWGAYITFKKKYLKEEEDAEVSFVKGLANNTKEEQNAP